MSTVTAYDGQLVVVIGSPGRAFVMLFAGNDDNDQTIIDLTPDEARAVAESLKRVADEVDREAGEDR